MLKEVRIDKWLWAVRLFKTRSQASDACKKSRILINNQLVKSSRTIKVGDIFQVKRPPVTFSYEVLALAEKRMGAKLVSEYLKDITTPDQIEILELQKINHHLNRQKGSGRPTKKERREIEDFTQTGDSEDVD